MKKILALILCLAMVFSLTAVLAGCGDEEEDTKDKTSDVDKDTEKEDKEDKEDADKDEEVKDADFCNTWKGKWDLKYLFEAEAETAGDDDLAEIIVPNKFEIDMILTINDDGTYSIGIDEDSFKDAADDYFDNVAKKVVDYIAEAAEAEGLTKEDMYEAFGVSSDDEMAEYFIANAGLSIDDMINTNDLSEDGEYEVDGDVAVFDGEAEMTFKIKGNKMTASWEIDGQKIDQLPTTFTVK